MKTTFYGGGLTKIVSLPVGKEINMVYICGACWQHLELPSKF